MRIGAILSSVRILTLFSLQKSKIKSTQMHREMETFQKVIIRHSIIAEVALHALAIEQRANFFLHYCRRWVDDHEVELVERRHQSLEAIKNRPRHFGRRH